MKEVKLDDVHPEIRKLAVAWGEGKHFSMIETMQLGMQIQYVFDKIKEDEANKT